MSARQLAMIVVGILLAVLVVWQLSPWTDAEVTDRQGAVPRTPAHDASDREDGVWTTGSALARDTDSGSASVAPPLRGQEIDVERLMELGLSSGRIETIDLAWREAAEAGELPEPGVRQERGYDRKPVRDFLGDDDYDVALYGAQLPNRVVFTKVNPGGNAAMAGIIEGDEIIEYGDGRVFEIREVGQIMSSQGRQGDKVRVVISRDGRLLETELPRGWGTWGARTYLLSVEPLR